MLKKEQVFELLNMLKVPYCIINKAGFFSRVNNEYCKLFGYSEKELIGNHFTDVQSKKERKELNNFMKYETFFRHPVLYKEQDKFGNTFEVNTISYDYEDENGEEYRLAINYKDLEGIDNLLNPKVINMDSLSWIKEQMEVHLGDEEEYESTLITLKLMDAIINEEVKEEIYHGVYSILSDIFTEGIIFSIKNNFLVFLFDKEKESDLFIKLNQIKNYFNSPIKVGNFFFKENFKMGVSKHKGQFDFNSLYNTSKLALGKSNENDYLIYGEDLEEELKTEFEINHIIFDSFRNNEFIPYYQCYYDINTKELKGMEALMRLESKKYGIISPGRFIPILEKNFFILKIERDVIEKVFRDIRKWKKEGKKIVPVAINLSVLQFKDLEFLNFLKEKSKEYEIDSKDIILEITESILIDNIELSKFILNEMKKMGYKISIDDYGTGYSSLAYLKELPIDNLKIDMSFIRDIHLNQGNEVIVETTILMAKRLGLTTICEGIEKVEELSVLKKIGADIVQGYIYHKPCKSDKLEI